MEQKSPGLHDTSQRWRDAVVYQIYPRSFADSDGDGLGDLAGITSRVAYLADLGVDAVWLSPFYPSPLADGGYDIADYRNVDPRLGSLADFDELVRTLHAADIQLIIDIVPNHTSNEHPWFREALASPPGSRARERYIIRPGSGTARERPPSDWPSHFGGGAWSRLPDGEWYLHLFAPEQPDLNWENPEVREEFLTTLRFWADRGVDGFRVDVAHLLIKDLSEPLRSKRSIDRDALVTDGSDSFEDRNEVQSIYHGWRALFDSYDPPRFAVAEVWVPASRRVQYAHPTSLGQAFNFDLLSSPWEAQSLRGIITANLALAHEAGSSSTWVLSSHDAIRHATRYAFPTGTDLVAWLLSEGRTPPEDTATGLRRARAATQLVLALPGAAYIYQGEELGLREVANIPLDRLQDPVWTRSSGARKGRDGCRVPLPWSAQPPSFGFSAAPAHLPQPEWFAELSVESQQPEPSSTLNLYRAALRLRRSLRSSAPLEWLEHDDPHVLHFARGSWHSVTNIGPRAVELPAGELVLASDEFDGRLLPPDTTAWLVR